MLSLWSDLYLSCPWLKEFKRRRWNFSSSLRWHLTDLGNRYQLWWAAQEGLRHEWLLKANKIVMHSVHLTSHSSTKDFFLLDFIFFLIVTVTNRAETDQTLDTVKTVAKRHNIQRMLPQNPCKLQIPPACIWQSNSEPCTACFIIYNDQNQEQALTLQATSLFFLQKLF